MSNETIRKKIMEVEEWKGTLIGFENCICEVEFWKNSYSYGIQPKGAKGFYDEQLTTMRIKNIEGLVMFMQGALWFRLHGKEK